MTPLSQTSHHRRAAINSHVKRSVNRGLVLDLVREHGPISRTSIARISNLNKSTVSSIVNGLLDQHPLTEELVRNALVGRKPLNLCLKAGKHLVGALSVDSMVTSRLASLETAHTQHHFPQARSIGITVAGVVDSVHSKVEFAPLLGWEDLDLGTLLHEICPEVGGGSEQGGHDKLGHTRTMPTSLGMQPSLLGAAAISYREVFGTTTS